MLQGQSADACRIQQRYWTDPKHVHAPNFEITNRSKSQVTNGLRFVYRLRKTQRLGFPQPVHVNPGHCLKLADENLLSLLYLPTNHGTDRAWAVRSDDDRVDRK
jgi:hypothetical protein